MVLLDKPDQGWEKGNVVVLSLFYRCGELSHRIERHSGPQIRNHIFRNMGGSVENPAPTVGVEFLETWSHVTFPREAGSEPEIDSRCPMAQTRILTLRPSLFLFHILKFNWF